MSDIIQELKDEVAHLKTERRMDQEKIKMLKRRLNRFEGCYDFFYNLIEVIEDTIVNLQQ